LERRGLTPLVPLSAIAKRGKVWIGALSKRKSFQSPSLTNKLVNARLGKRFVREGFV
jgi:hypothetical protein